MRKIFFIIAFLGLTALTGLLVACSDNNVIVEEPMQEIKMTLSRSGETASVENFTVAPKMVCKYINIARKGKTVNSLTPVIENGDTLAYVVQYADSIGWDLISGDSRVAPILASSPTGVLNLDDAENPAVGAVKGMVNVVLEVKFGNDSIKHSVWELLEPKIQKNSQQQSRALIGRGMWIGKDTTYNTINTTTPRLIPTKWGQGYPWNNYTPYSGLTHSVVGCGPVAAGQIIYKYVSRNPGNFTIPTTASVPESGAVSFSDFSSDVWSQMAKTSNDTGTNYTALFLSRLGQRMNANYSASATSTTASSIIDILNYYMTFSTLDYYNYNTLISNLKSGIPVLIMATSSTTNAAHAFIVDSYETNATQFIVRYEFDPDHYITEEEFNRLPSWYFEMPMEDKENETGIYEMEMTTDVNENVYIKMNWGYGGSYDDYRYLSYYKYYPLYNGSSYSNQVIRTLSPSWAVGNNTYDTVYKMLYNFKY